MSADRVVPQAEYDRIDALLEVRAAEYPLRLQPTWGELTSRLEAVASLLRETVCRPPRQVPSTHAQEAGAAVVAAPVFLVGYYKTGTSLVLGLLDGHPELAVLPAETGHFFPPAEARTEPWEARLDRLHARAIHWFINPVGLPPFWTLGRPAAGDSDPYEQLSSYLYWFASTRREGDLLGVLAAAAAAVSLDRGVIQRPPRHWVEKTPTHELWLDEILAAYPNAKFVQSVRDPRPTLAAVLRRPDWPFDPLSVSAAIRKSLDAARVHERSLGRDRYHVLRYEDLVGDPEACMRRLADFLRIEYDERLLTPTLGGRVQVANSGWAERRVAGRIHALSLELRADALDARASRLVSAIAGPRARELGYDLPRIGTAGRYALLARELPRVARGRLRSLAGRLGGRAATGSA